MLTILKNINVGIQSWCFRGLKGNEDNIAALKKCDVNAIEICGIHVDVNNKSEASQVIKLYKDNKISFNSCGIDHYSLDETKIRNLFEFAIQAGIKVLGADPDPEAFPLIDKLCDEYNVKIAIHNHGRYHRYGNISQLEEAFSKSSPNIGLCLDTGWALDSHVDPVEMIDKFANRLYGVHLKDFNFDSEGKEVEAVLGTGELDLKAVLKALKSIDYTGYITLEYEGEPENPLPNVMKCLDSLR